MKSNIFFFDHFFILLIITETFFSYIFNDFLFINLRIFTEFLLQCSFCDGPLCYYCNNKWRLIFMKITLTFLDTSSLILIWFFVISSPLDLLYHHEVPWEVSMFFLFTCLSHVFQPLWNLQTFLSLTKFLEILAITGASCT